MPAPRNAFKAALRAGRPQIGLWVGLADPYAAELLAGTGFDWLVVDGEHAPNDLRSMLAQLQAMATGTAAAVIRLPVGETWMIKQVLDIGCQTLLVPMVESGEQARELARATRYPPLGVRGVGAGLARASRFNSVPDYLRTADDEICLLVQVESRAGLDALDDIAAVEGVDGVFIGPSDLAADMGLIGQPGHPDVQALVENAIARLRARGKPAGLLIGDPAIARRALALGAAFVAVGTDIGLLGTAARQLAASFAAVPGR